MLNKKFNVILLFSLLTVFLLAACNSKPATKETEGEKETMTETVRETVAESLSETEAESQTEALTVAEIKDNRTTQMVPLNAESIVVLDSRSFETLADWKVKLAAVPKDVMSPESPFVKDESVLNIGNHREPNFEVLASVNPQIVIVGQRFIQHFDAIKEVVPNAVVLDININLEGEKPGKDLVEGFKNNTEILGKIFNKSNEASGLIAKFDSAVEAVKNADKGELSFLGVIVSGGQIGYSAPVKGRVWGPIFTLFDLKHSLDIENASSDHQGDEISVEAIAESNPDVLLVLDRDASVANSESSPAKDVIEGSEAITRTNAVKNNKLFYAPNDTYTNESIQTFTELFQNLAEFLVK